MRQSDGGFTLIELMIVIAIIGILAAIAIPNFLNARGRAQDAAAKKTLIAMKLALEAYTANIGYYPTPADDDLSALQTAMGEDWPSNLFITGTNSGTLSGFRSSNNTYAVTAVGRNTSYYYHLQQNGTLSGPDSNSSIDD